MYSQYSKPAPRLQLMGEIEMSKVTREREALQNIRQIIDHLGMESFVGTALEGALELAESNIQDSTYDSARYFMEKSWEMEKQAYMLKKERDALQAAIKNQKEAIRLLENEKARFLKECEQLQSEAAALKIQLFDLMNK